MVDLDDKFLDFFLRLLLRWSLGSSLNFIEFFPYHCRKDSPIFSSSFLTWRLYVWLHVQALQSLDMIPAKKLRTFWIKNVEHFDESTQKPNSNRADKDAAGLLLLLSQVREPSDLSNLQEVHARPPRRVSA